MAAKAGSVVVPQPAGNSPDVLCRVIADKLSRALGQLFVVENRAGAANLVGTQAVAAPRPMDTLSCLPLRPRSS